MTDASIGFLLENFKELVLYHQSFLGDIKDDVDMLVKDLTLFKTFLQDCTERSRMSYVQKEFVRQVRDLVYRSEDAIDRYVRYVSSRPKIWRLLSGEYRRLVDDIKAIMAETKSMYNMLYNFANLIVESRDISENCEKALVLMEDGGVVGFENDTREVVKLLQGGSDRLEVISIVGMPGIGKTTLVGMVLHNADVKDTFEVRARAHVPEVYTRKGLLVSVLENFGEGSVINANLTEIALCVQIQNHLAKKKYLIVLDNVHSEDALDYLANALPSNEKGSRVLLTTTISNVAKLANQTYELQPLSDHESWDLLRMKAIGLNECAGELETYGKSIAKKCKGVRLALIVLAALLNKKGPERYWWEKFDGFMEYFLFSDTQRRLDMVIERCYDRLPYHLKNCLVYIAMFPEDAEILVNEIYGLWIAEGFVEQQSEMSLEDMAEEYMEELLNHNLVIAREQRLDGTVKTCQMHFIVREFCKNKAEDEHFFRCSVKASCEASREVSEVRRLSLGSDILRFLSLRCVHPRVRSIICSSTNKIDSEPDVVSYIVEDFELVRVLRIGDLSFSDFPVRIAELIHLKSIAISGKFKIVPKSISHLWNLQSFLIETTLEVLRIEADLRKMTKLRHLITNAKVILPDELTQAPENYSFTTLQTLSSVAPESCTTKLVAAILNLHKLGIRGRLGRLPNGGTDWMRELRRVKNLKLHNDDPPHPQRFSIPQAEKFPPLLKKLTLSGTRLDWDDMITLGQLLNLEILKLEDEAVIGAHWQSGVGAFLVLKVLLVGKTDLENWEVSVGQFPQLKRLYLEQCSKLKRVPINMAELSSLEILGLKDTNGDVINSANEIKSLKQKRADGSRFKLEIKESQQVQPSASTSSQVQSVVVTSSP